MSEDPPTGRQLTCLLVHDRDDGGLSAALAHYLSCELPGIAFTLDERVATDVVWLCAAEPDDVARVRWLREDRPWAVILVTRRGASAAWRQAVLAAGADLVGGWPLDHGGLAQLLRHARALAVRAGVAS
jgi:hypothetical protein